MKSWLKFFGLSFFSDKIAKEARIRGSLNVLLGFVLSLIFIFIGVLTANAAPFKTHYGGSPDFRAFVANALDRASLSVSDGRVSSEDIFDTYINDGDAEKFSVNGYNLVIDTRPSSAFDDFQAYCLSKDGKTELAYADYLALSDEEKKSYDFKIRYTPKELVLTDDLVGGYESFLNSLEEGKLKSQYAELASQKGGLSAEEYESKVYGLYLQAYYPEYSGVAPLLRNYYYQNYIYAEEVGDCLFVFEDMLLGFFTTGRGVEINFYGTYQKTADGALSAEDADSFIKGAFAATLSLRAYVYLMNMFRLLPFFALIPLALALAAKVALTVIKDEKYKKFGVCLKIEGSYLAVAALLTALITFILGFFLSSNKLNVLPLAVYGIVLLARTLVLIAGEYLNVKKSGNGAPQTGAEEFGNDDSIA